MATGANVVAVFTGRPKTMLDERGRWRSSIFRDRVAGPVAISMEGLAGDKVTQPFHGGPGAAICVHLMDHYDFWNARLGMDLKPGYAGENVTLGDITEDQIWVGDVVRLGTALVQVSGPRMPCATLARRIGRPDWVKLTIQENRAGFYLRVLEPGVVKEGDGWRLERRLNEGASIPAVMRCLFLEFDADFARAMVEMEGLEEWWREQARKKLAKIRDGAARARAL